MLADKNNPINWQDVVKLTGNKPEVAKEMIEMFANELPTIQQQVNAYYAEEQYGSLLEVIHRLHGSCCYCGVPTLKNLAALLEAQLKYKSYTDLDYLIKQLNQEINHVLEYINQQVQQHDIS